MAKKAVTYSYVFTPGAAGVGTINFNGISNFDIKKLYGVFNLTQSKTLYIAGNASYGFVSVAGSTVTLIADTTGHVGTDQLLIIYEDQDVAVKNTLPLQSDYYLPVRPLPQQKFRTTFAKVIASGVDSEFFNVIKTGAGSTVSQSGGNLVIASGTTINSETILRSVQSFSDALIMRYKAILSQRIANSNFFVELVDVIGDNLTATASSATSLTVTIPSNPFTSANVGQSMYIGNLGGSLVGVPGRYAIASVSGNDVTFTVAGWTASSGTVSLFGWNYHQVQYTGVTATNAAYDCQRRGWNSGQTTATINTTASPGHVGIMICEDGVAAYLDQLVASSTALQTTMRASRVENIPAQETQLYIQIRCLNGSTAPASSTTLTMGFVALENYASQNITINQIKPQGFNGALPVQFPSTPTVTVGTLPATPAGTNAIGDVGVQYRASATGAATAVSILSPATPAGASIKASAGRLIGWQFQNSSTGVRSVKFFNATAVTMGTTGAAFEVDIPAGGRTEVQLPGGIAFGTGIMWAVTSAKGLTDNTATGLAANDVSGSVFYA